MFGLGIVLRPGAEHYIGVIGSDDSLLCPNSDPISTLSIVSVAAASYGGPVASSCLLAAQSKDDGQAVRVYPPIPHSTILQRWTGQRGG